MLSVIKWTLWQRKWSLFWWSIGIVAFVVLELVFYPSVRDQAAELNKSFGSFSNSTMALFGGTDFFSPLGYLNSQLIYLMLPLLLLILGIGLGGSLIGREEVNGSLESLLARPISRSRLLLAKTVAGSMCLLLVTTIATLATIGMAQAVNLGVPLGNIAAACFVCFLLVLTFSSVAFLLAATGRGRAAALGISTVYALGGYIISSLASTVHWLDKPSLVFPYHYYRSADILAGRFDWASAAFFLVFIVATGTLAWISFCKRDLE